MLITAAAVPNLGSALFAFTVNLAAIIVFAVLMFFRRYTKPGLTVVFVFFNVGLFAVVTVIMRTEINAAVGFGLFAMLSIIRLRSDPFSPREIGYFFGALALGLINGLGPPDAFTVFLNVAVLATMYVVDHPRLFVVPPSLDVTFDRVIADPAELRRRLEDRLGVHVREVTVQSIDYVRDIMELKVQYLPTGRVKGGTSSRTPGPHAPANTRRRAPNTEPAPRRPRTQAPAPRPPAVFQVPPAARVAAPVAASAAGPPTAAVPPSSGPPSSVVPPSRVVPPSPVVPGSVVPPSPVAPPPPPTRATEPVAASPADPAEVPAIDRADSSPSATAPPGTTSPPGPPATPAADSVPRDRLFAPTAGPVFAPSAGPPTNRPVPPPARPQGPISPEAVPDHASYPWHPDPDHDPLDDLEEPESGEADTGRAWDKVLGRLNSWIVS